MAATIGVKIQLEGAPQYVENMKNLAQQTKLYEAQMKSLQSRLKGESAFQRSITESKALKQQLEAQQNQLKLLSQEIEKATAKYGEDSTQVARLKTQYEQLEGKIADTKNQIIEHGGAIGAVGAQLQEVGNKLQSVGDTIAHVGDTLTTKVTIPIATAFGASIKSAIDWESAFTGVMKTVDETVTTSYADIEEGLKKMATETASSKEEIAGVAEVAGQLGISADNIVGFTKTMVELGDTTNLSADEAATSLARLLNITGESVDNVDRVGSAIVALGNNFATSESEIVGMSTRLASAGTIAGMSTTDILALSAAMSSVGIQAEAGGTAMTQTLTNLEKNVASFRTGAENNLAAIAKIAGTSAEEFATTWENEPIQAVSEFISGLGNLDEQGESATMVLDELGMSGIRQANMLKSLSLASGVLTDAIGMSSSAYETNTALSDEAALRYQTMEAKINQLKESLTNLAVEIGERLMPYVEQIIAFIDGLIQKWNELDIGVQDAIIKIALIAAALGPILAIGGRIISGIGTIMTVGGELFSIVGTLTTSIGGLSGVISALTSPVTLVIAAVAALVAGFVYFYNTNEEFREKVNAVWEQIKSTIQTAIDLITVIIQMFVEQAQLFWQEHGETIMLILQTVLDLIMTTIQTVMTVIQEIILTIMAIIEGDWDAAWEHIRTIFTTVLDGIKTKVTTIFEAVKNIIKEKINAVLDQFGIMDEDIRNTINGLIDSAFQWGSDLIQGFIDGIKSMISGVIGAVQSVANTVAQYLHFSEPDKGAMRNFNEWPKHMMEQYAEGIENGRYLVKKSVMDVAADVSLLNDPIDPNEIYNAVNAGASNANITLTIGDREMTRALRGMGVAFA